MNYAFFIIQIAFIYLLSRKNIEQLFQVSHFFLRKKTLSYLFIASLFFPGTVLHEAAHTVTAFIMLLKVRSVELFPHQQDGGLRLGSVFYEKKDPVRAVIVGIAPIFAGLAFFWAISFFKLFPNQDRLIFTVMGYLIFAVSSTMFSSRQDMKDIIVALPLLIIIGGAIYVIFGFSWLNLLSAPVKNFINIINMYLLFCLFIHIILLVAFGLFRRLIKV